MGVGGVGLLSTLIQSFKKFYNAEEKAADHNSVAKQFGSFYRYMTLQLGMSREDRDPADVLSTWALKEYERLQQEAPPIGGASVALFNQKFDKDLQAIPDVAEDKFIIKKQPVTMAKIIRRMNEYCNCTPPKNLPTKEITMHEWWVSK